MLIPIIGRLIMRFLSPPAPKNVLLMSRHYKGNGLVCQLPCIRFNDAFPLTYNQLSPILTEEKVYFVIKNQEK
jgi:hypothetical protein